VYLILVPVRVSFVFIIITLGVPNIYLKETYVCKSVYRNILYLPVYHALPHKTCTPISEGQLQRKSLTTYSISYMDPNN
jgi:hypothetical protein